jgi:2-polyprenyl-3-methyl-5-hydroxy-6-metoxy-1,4-benzoquinol methylase
VLRRLRFNLWYLFRPPWDSGISPPELLDFIAKHPAGRAIDLGCGTGTNAVTLAEHGWQVTGIDFAPRAIQIALGKARKAGVAVTFLVGEVTGVNGLVDHFDFALDLGCFHGIPNREAYLSALNRLLLPGGYWLMYGFFRTGDYKCGPGLDATALDLIRSRGFLLRSRTDGADKWERPSAWFLYQKPN